MNTSGSRIFSTILRKNCVICNRKLPGDEAGELYTLPKVPIHMGVVEERATEGYIWTVQDQVWTCCYACDCVQLKYLIPLEVLYKNSHNSGKIGPSWENHHTKFSQFIIENASGAKSIVEIGAGNGILRRLLSQHFPNTKYIIIDPTMTSDQDAFGDKCIIINSLLSDINTSIINFNVDLIVHSHTLEHFYDPISALNQMYDMLSNDGYMIFSVPMIDKMLEDGHTNALNFEHTYSISIPSLTKMLKSSYFSQSDIIWEIDNQNYNIFACVQKKKGGVIHNFYNYVKNLEKLCVDIGDQIQKLNAVSPRPRPVYLFGAHVFSQTLLNMGLSETVSDIVGILDNDKDKQGKILYGTLYKVWNPNILSGISDPIVIVNAGRYTPEIIAQLEEINEFVTILPTPGGSIND